MQDSAGPHFIRSGDRNGSSTIDQGTRGFYWSSSAWTSATRAYDLRLNDADSTVYPVYDHPKSYGFSLRCLAQ